MSQTFKIEIKGLVQGVGFRPFIYRIANIWNIKGWVMNSNHGVIIKAQFLNNNIINFIDEIRLSAPSVSRIDSINYYLIDNEYFNDFQIIKSIDESDNITEISPDIAVCNDCLLDMKLQQNRINYPFINCTNCGPRFSIINNLPYDRSSTSMHIFDMCNICSKEYNDVADRRFHAQPVACNNCGPIYTLLFDNENINNLDRIILLICQLLQSGKIVGFKGVSGFHIACNALSNDAVKRLRLLKNRDAKPFAVMFAALDALKEYAYINDAEEKALLSWRRPIVLLNQKKRLAESINNGLNSIGAMLPYMPFHHLLFESLNLPAIVMTSGNISDEPVIIDNASATEKLSPITDALLLYNRDIVNRSDDSVVTIINNKERIYRRSRGYAPAPVNMNLNVNGIFAAGAELKNCFCIGKGNSAFLSQHIGDLKNLETYQFYSQSIDNFIKLFRVKPQLFVCDMHPDYLSTKYAIDKSNYYTENLLSKHTSPNLPQNKLIRIQHHHAHIASVMAENNLDENIIGVSLDGTGYGNDGNIWGSEFMICNLTEFSRYSHFEYMRMPGSDLASRQPWRMAIYFLYKVFGTEFLKLKLPFFKSLDKNKVDLVIEAMNKNINCPLTSGAGRLFDAIASLTGICQVNSFEAEAPIRLEAVIDNECSEKYTYRINKTVSFDETIREIVMDVLSDVNVSTISAKFHNTVISVIFEVVNNIRNEHNISTVALSGGTFQNKYILEKTESLLSNNNFRVFSNLMVPANDGGIALGQLAIAAKLRETGKLNV